VLCGMNQSAMNLVSYLPAEARPAQLERMIWGASGTVLAFAVHSLFRLLQARRNTTQKAGPSPCGEVAPISFVVKVAAAESAVWLISSCFLIYNAYDRLSEAGMASIVTPIMVASCIVGFAVYGMIVLREKPNLFQILGIACNLAGIACMALP